ncbi:asparagine synthase [Nitritalea halalkaliphila LW7]|uniref:asparagine synthase (glutamine-hydrolyzing) n=2 Tax=Nitritalea TaxID=1187887 RepID=I5C610_9BACT|nr:asparagine synthase [Nitritalea halalkaliphila LW7]
MVASLTHRGPDSQDQIIFEEEHVVLGLGHTRLSIIDLSSFANQPMQLGPLYLVYNGEVYNYPEIKQELSLLGHQFTTNSDTEVILHAYQQWGQEAVKKFRGMFAFAIYDKNKKELFLCRDRAGIKPLFVYHKDNVLLFASELKAFHQHPHFQPEINPDAVYSFFNFGYVQSPHCIFQHCYKVEAGQSITYSLDSLTAQKNTYWTLDAFFTKEKLDVPYKQAKETLRELLFTACQYRMVADVPVGVFLSSGYDSTLVTAMLQKEADRPLQTFTIGFNAGNNEAPFAKKIAQHLKTEHHEYICTEKEAEELIPQLPYYFDEPFADSSAIPTALVSQFAKQHVTVALSADGGDEGFAGYPRYVDIPSKLEKLQKTFFLNKKGLATFYDGINTLIPPHLEKSKHVLTAFSKTLRVPASHQNSKLCESLRVTPEYHTRRLLKGSFGFIGFTEKVHQLDPMDELMLADFNFYLQNDILTKIDRATMMFSLEGREPLLDHHLLEYAAQLPSNFKFRNGILKYILKDILHDYVPEPLMQRKKSGFEVPVMRWLNGDLAHLLDTYFEKAKLDAIPFIDSEYALYLLGRFRANKLYYKDIIWKLLMFIMWWERWLKHEAA